MVLATGASTSGSSGRCRTGPRPIIAARSRLCLRIGRFTRLSQVPLSAPASTELPQFFNVLAGQMSIVRATAACR